MPHVHYAQVVAVSRDEILSAIRREAEAQGGRPPGVLRFQQATGIKVAQWRGRYWARWSEAVVEAGFAPNQWQGRVATDDQILRRLADLALELGHYPTSAEQRLRHRQDSEFPGDNTIASRIGDRATQLRRLLDLSLAEPGYSPLHDMVGPLLTPAGTPTPAQQVALGASGSVYLMRTGVHHKIGRSTHISRYSSKVDPRHPGRAQIVHEIETDDPEGIERYWHQRFARKRINEECFALTDDDVRAFMRRRSFM